MSEGIVIALIGFVGAVLGAAIAGFATVTAAGIKGKGEGSISCGLVGLLASLGAAGGLVLGAVFGASLIRSSYPISVSEPQVLQPTPPRPTQQIQSQIATPISSYTQDDLNTLLGVGNWRCIDGFPNSISISNVPPNFVVRSPIIRVDKQNAFYYSGDTVPSGGYATAWLESSLPNNQCSTTQAEITQAIINGLVGVGNWYCLEQYPTGVKVRNVPANFLVQSPAIFMDKYDVRYYKGDTVPGGGPATLWFSNEVPRSECP